MRKVDINNSEDNLHTGSTEREHCPNAQTSGKKMIKEKKIVYKQVTK